MRQKFRTHRGAEGTAALAASDAAESGKLIVEAKSISKSFGDLTVVSEFSTRIQRGDRIGLVGPNGAGKTTLLKMLTGELAPDSGTVRLGVNLEIATLDQKRAAVDPTETLAHFLTDGRGETLLVNIKLLHTDRDQALFVVRVVYREALAQAYPIVILAHNAETNRVEGARPHRICNVGILKGRKETVFYLSRRLIRKGDGKHAPRRRRLERKSRKNFLYFAYRKIYRTLKRLDLSLSNVTRHDIGKIGVAVFNEI
jgi:hypothetical protein